MSANKLNYIRQPISDLNGEFNHAASINCSPGDLVYWDSGNNVIKPVSSFGDLGAIAVMQLAIARLFMGVSASSQLSSDSTARGARIILDQICEFPCVSATFVVGDYVGINYTASALVDQQLIKVTNPALAIGRVVRREASAVTTVKVRLMSRYLLGHLADPFRGVGSFQGSGTAVALSDAANTITVDQGPFFTQIPTAHRNITLPLEAQSAGLKFYFTNNSGGAFNMVLKASDGSTTVITIGQAKAGIAWCDGTTWRGLLGA